jgi:hypothetical protein
LEAPDVEEWWVHGKLHRINGPAVTLIDGEMQWWRDGVRVLQETHCLS